MMAGRTLSHYQLLSEVGRGGMGIVYRARDLTLDRDVALKVLPPDLVADADRKARFVREAKAAAALRSAYRQLQVSLAAPATVRDALGGLLRRAKRPRIAVDSGGYQNPSFWQHEFVQGGRVLPFKQAMEALRDKTGRQGPSTWEAGAFPEDQEQYPIRER